jgi:hypothetical protein
VNYIYIFFIYCTELHTDIFSLQKLLAAFGTLLACVLNLKVIQQVSNIYFYILRDWAVCHCPTLFKVLIKLQNDCVTERLNMVGLCLVALMVQFCYKSLCESRPSILIPSVHKKNSQSDITRV